MTKLEKIINNKYVLGVGNAFVMGAGAMAGIPAYFLYMAKFLAKKGILNPDLTQALLEEYPFWEYVEGFTAMGIIGGSLFATGTAICLGANSLIESYQFKKWREKNKERIENCHKYGEKIK